MNDVFTAILVTRGIERLTVALIGGICFILGWHLMAKTMQRSSRIDLGEECLTKGLIRVLCGLFPYFPTIVFVIIGCWLLASVMRPVSATVIESGARDAANPVPMAKGDAAITADAHWVYRFEDSGLFLDRVIQRGEPR